MSVAARFWFSDGRTDNIREINDHLFDRCLGGSKSISWIQKYVHYQVQWNVQMFNTGPDLIFVPWFWFYIRKDGNHYFWWVKTEYRNSSSWNILLSICRQKVTKKISHDISAIFGNLLKTVTYKAEPVVSDHLGQPTHARQWWSVMFRSIMKSGDGRTPRVNIVITTGRVRVGLGDQLTIALKVTKVLRIYWPTRLHVTLKRVLFGGRHADTMHENNDHLFSRDLVDQMVTSLANLRWPTRPQPIGSHYFHAWPPLYRVFYVSVVACFCFSDGQTYGRTDVRTYGRTDTTCENNDHLFGRGLVGQK